MANRKWLAASFGVVALLGFSATPSKGANEGFNDVARTTYLTFNQSVRLPGVSLGTGTYIFELADPMGAWNVVRISSRDRRQIYLTTFTRVVPRPPGLSHDQLVSFAEAPANVPQPITAWWPIGEKTGRQFIY